LREISANPQGRISDVCLRHPSDGSEHQAIEPFRLGQRASQAKIKNIKSQALRFERTVLTQRQKHLRRLIPGMYARVDEKIGISSTRPTRICTKKP
jgi:hypothetical protein